MGKELLKKWFTGQWKNKDNQNDIRGIFILDEYNTYKNLTFVIFNGELKDTKLGTKMSIQFKREDVDHLLSFLQDVRKLI